MAKSSFQTMMLNRAADYGRLLGAMAAFVAGKDVNLAIRTANNAVDHNFLAHHMMVGLPLVSKKAGEVLRAMREGDPEQIIQRLDTPAQHVNTTKRQAIYVTTH